MLFLVFAVTLSVFGFSFVEFSCDRGTGLCNLSEITVTGNRKREFKISNLLSARINQEHNKGKKEYSLTLLTKHGDINVNTINTTSLKDNREYLDNIMSFIENKDQQKLYIEFDTIHLILKSLTIMFFVFTIIFLVRHKGKKKKKR